MGAFWPSFAQPDQVLGRAGAEGDAAALGLAVR
jgi:hypothetical protein